MKYEKPIIIDNNDVLEGVYAASGSDELPWSVEVWWEGHDSGSHSEVQLKCHNDSGKGGNFLEITIRFTGVGNIINASVGDASWNCDQKGNVIKIWRDASFNQGENYGIMISSITFDTPQYDPSKTNPSNDGGYSYWATGSGHDHIIAGEFIVSSVRSH